MLIRESPMWYVSFFQYLQENYDSVTFSAFNLTESLKIVSPILANASYNIGERAAYGKW
jgi:hypothetical protein